MVHVYAKNNQVMIFTRQGHRASGFWCRLYLTGLDKSHVSTIICCILKVLSGNHIYLHCCKDWCWTWSLGIHQRHPSLPFLLQITCGFHHRPFVWRSCINSHVCFPHIFLDRYQDVTCKSIKIKMASDNICR